MASLIKFGLTMELLLLTTGLISTFFMLKKAISPYYLFNMFFVNLSEILNYLKSFLSSPLYICLFINSVVILILTFSKFQHTIKKFIDIFLDEKDVDYDEVQIQPQAHHQEKEEYMPNRTNSAIAMDTVMSFFNRYNSHPDIQDDMLTTITTPHESQISWGRLKAKIDRPQTTTTTTLPQSQTRRDPLRAKANSPKTTLPQSQTSWDRLNAKIDSPDISHLAEAREIVSPCSSDHEKIIRTNYQENIEGGEIEGDSLEATWKAITKKKELKKSLTFNDALSMSRIGGLRGDISVNTEESNNKFDDFIKKINQERLLQRQESHQHAHNVNMLNRAR